MLIHLVFCSHLAHILLTQSQPSRSEFWGLCFGQFFLSLWDAIAVPLGIVSILGVWRIPGFIKSLKSQNGTIDDFAYNCKMLCFQVFFLFSQYSSEVALHVTLSLSLVKARIFMFANFFVVIADLITMCLG